MCASFRMFMRLRLDWLRVRFPKQLYSYNAISLFGNIKELMYLSSRRVEYNLSVNLVKTLKLIKLIYKI